MAKISRVLCHVFGLLFYIHKHPENMVYHSKHVIPVVYQLYTTARGFDVAHIKYYKCNIYVDHGYRCIQQIYEPSLSKVATDKS